MKVGRWIRVFEELVPTLKLNYGALEWADVREAFVGVVPEGMYKSKLLMEFKEGVAYDYLNYLKSYIDRVFGEGDIVVKNGEDNKVVVEVLDIDACCDEVTPNFVWEEVLLLAYKAFEKYRGSIDGPGFRVAGLRVHGYRVAFVEFRKGIFESGEIRTVEEAVRKKYPDAEVSVFREGHLRIKTGNLNEKLKEVVRDGS